jgi:transmembrane 9 superfamily protein 2/4
MDGPVQHFWQDAIREDYHYNIEVDGMPVAIQQEDDFKVTTRYWGGAPLGRMGGNKDGDMVQFEGTSHQEAFVNNHWNIEIVYQQVDSGDTDEDTRYRIIRTTVQPFSVKHQFHDDALGVNIYNPIASCQSDDTSREHTTYAMVADMPPQPASGKVLFTYDVIWKEYNDGDDSKKAARNRWDVFLTLDDAIPVEYQIASLVFAIIVNCIIWGTLIFWVMRDLSYKPVFQADDDDGDGEDGLTEQEKAEIALWPLSGRIYVPPHKAPYLLTVFCGTGAHLLLTSMIFLVFFRVGIINQSLGARMITPAVIIAVCTAPLGGYVTGRMTRMFGGTVWLSLLTSFATGVIYPLAGIITIGFCYDVFPGALAPQYNVLTKSLPIILTWIWIMIPLTMVGGYFGYRAGSLSAFPITANMDHSDLEITVDEDAPSDTWIGYGYRCWKTLRTPLLFILGGILPVLCCFAAFSYGIAGPIFLGYYSSIKLASIAPFVLFVSCSAGVAVLLQYRQLRIQQHLWWWPAFVTGSSSGLHIWLLALSWLFFNIGRGDVAAGTFATHLFWFAYLGAGVACLCGSASVGACLLFHIVLRRFISSREEREPMLDAHNEKHDEEYNSGQTPSLWNHGKPSDYDQDSVETD